MFILWALAVFLAFSTNNIVFSSWNYNNKTSWYSSILLAQTASHTSLATPSSKLSSSNSETPNSSDSYTPRNYEIAPTARRRWRSQCKSERWRGPGFGGPRSVACYQIRSISLLGCRGRDHRWVGGIGIGWTKRRKIYSVHPHNYRSKDSDGHEWPRNGHSFCSACIEVVALCGRWCSICILWIGLLLRLPRCQGIRFLCLRQLRCCQASSKPYNSTIQSPSKTQNHHLSPPPPL